LSQSQYTNASLEDNVEQLREELEYTAQSTATHVDALNEKYRWETKRQREDLERRLEKLEKDKEYEMNNMKELLDHVKRENEDALKARDMELEALKYKMARSLVEREENNEREMAEKEKLQQEVNSRMKRDAHHEKTVFQKTIGDLTRSMDKLQEESKQSRKRDNANWERRFKDRDDDLRKLKEDHAVQTDETTREQEKQRLTLEKELEAKVNELEKLKNEFLCYDAKVENGVNPTVLKKSNEKKEG
jgi:hypothetical protein